AKSVTRDRAERSLPESWFHGQVAYQATVMTLTRVTSHSAESHSVLVKQLVATSRDERSMQTGAAAAWYAFTKGYEGAIPFMYLDTKGLVTVGVGNLIDPVAAARVLPFQFKTNNKLGQRPGQFATHTQIEAEWNHLKYHPKRAALMHDGHKLCASETNLELNPNNLLALFQAKSNKN